MNQVIDSIIENGKSIKGVTQVDVTDGGQTIVYGSSTLKTNVTVKGMIEGDVREELSFEQTMLDRKKKSIAEFKPSEILNTRALTGKEKQDIFRMHDQSMIDVEKTEKIVIPFLELRLKELSNKQKSSIFSEDGQSSLQTHQKIKAKYPQAIVLVRIDDYYETFGEDAEKSSRIVNIAITERENGKGRFVPLLRFPKYALDQYMPMIVRAGYQVALAEILESQKAPAKKPKGLPVPELVASFNRWGGGNVTPTEANVIEFLQNNHEDQPRDKKLIQNLQSALRKGKLKSNSSIALAKARAARVRILKLK